MAQQTAVEWLMQEYIKNPYDCLIKTGLFEKAKQIEKVEIMFAYNDGLDNTIELDYEGMYAYYEKVYGK